MIKFIKACFRLLFKVTIGVLIYVIYCFTAD